MKKNNTINLGIILICGILLFFSTTISIEAFNGNYVEILAGCDILSAGQREFLQTVFTTIRIIVPVLLVVLIIMDFVTAVTSQKEDQMKKAQKKAIQRIIIGVIIMFVPTIVNLILDLMGKGLTTCNIK